MRLATHLTTALALLALGCGSTSSDLTPGSSQASTLNPISGKIVSESGAPLAGVQIVAEERLSNRSTTALSDSDGSFTLPALRGEVFDLQLDLASDPNTATCLYGPLSAGESQQELRLRSTGARPKGSLFGRLELERGVPAPAQQIQVRLGSGRWVDSLDLAPVGVTTQGDGSFEVSLSSSQETELDLEVLNSSGSLRQFVDLSKQSKACYVEVALNHSPVLNRLRCNQSEPVPAGSSPSPRGLLPLQPPGLRKFSVAFASQGGHDWLKLSDGILPPGYAASTIPTPHSAIPDLTDYDFFNPSNFAQHIPFRPEQAFVIGWVYLTPVTPQGTTFKLNTLSAYDTQLWRITDLNGLAYFLSANPGNLGQCQLNLPEQAGPITSIEFATDAYQAGYP
ncbi:carboxypeptidase regulatory-like domain-containing protein [bacterium]|nr:carboxypeptidase regulatory-like domain-containing protein [bacterium]